MKKPARNAGTGIVIIPALIGIIACAGGKGIGNRGLAVEQASDITAFIQTGVNDSIVTLAYSPDAMRIASAAGNNIKIWDTVNGRELRTLSGHAKEIYQAAFSPDGKHIVSGSNDNTVKLWDAVTGRLIRTMEGHALGVHAVSFSPDGKHILSGSRDHTMKIWDAGTGSELLTIGEFGRSGAVVAVAYSPDCKQVVSNSRNNNVTVWDAVNGKRLLTLSGHWYDVVSVAYSPDGKYIASASKEEIKIWDSKTGLELRTFSDSYVGTIVFSPDGKQVVSARGFWNIESGVKRIIRNDVFSDPVACSPDGSRMLIEDGNSSFVELDVVSGLEIRKFTGYAERVNAIACSPDNRFIASASGYSVVTKGIISIWDLAEGRRYMMFTGHNCAVNALDYSIDGKKILSASDDCTIREWDTATGQMLRIIAKGVLWVTSVAYSPDGKKIVSEIDGYLKIWDTASGRELRSFPGHENGITSVAFSPDGKRFVTTSYHAKSRDDTVKVWDAETGKNLLNLMTLTGGARTAAFSPDGKRIITGNMNEIFIHDSETGRELKLLKGHTTLVTSVSFSPDGRRIVSGSEDNTIKIWDAISGQEILSFSRNTGRVYAVTYTLDGKKIVSGSDDGTTRIWDATTGKEIAQFVSFSGSDTQLASASRGLTVETETASSSIEGEWLSITPDGYYQASPRGDRYLNVRVNNTVSGIDSYRSVLYNPDVVQARLQGRSDPASKASVTIQQASNFTPPAVTINSPANFSTTNTATANLSVAITDQNQPIKNVKIIVNGRLVGRNELSTITGTSGLQPQKASLAVTGNQKAVNFTLPLNLDPGNNRIEVVAFNGYSENRRYIDVTRNAPAGEKPSLPNLWIVAVGVNTYDNAGPRLQGLTSLNYAVADAKGLVDSLKAQEGRRYAKVNVMLIADGEEQAPTTANIRRGLKFLEGAGPRDIVVLFLAGHGISAQESKFFFLPKDAAFSGERVVDASRAISGDEIMSVLDAPGNRLVFIDACQSGGVDNDRMVRSLMDTNAFVFTASRGSELSYESKELGHGFFTYSVMAALKGAPAALAQGQVSVLSMSGFVKDDVPRKTGGRQNPSAYSLGFYDFPMAVIK